MWREMSARRWGRVGSLIAVAACMWFFVRPVRVPRDTPSLFPGYKVDERQVVGLPFSPWAEWVHRGDRIQNGEVVQERREDWRIIWVSASWLLVAGAIGGLVAFRRLRPVQPTREEAAAA